MEKEAEKETNLISSAIHSSRTLLQLKLGTLRPEKYINSITRLP